MPRLFHAIAGAALMTVLAGVGAEAAPYALGAQDKVKVAIDDWPNISGQFAISADGYLTLPLLGPLKAEGLDPVTLADRIAQMVQQTEHLPATPSASVEVVEYRPFFVAGEVQKPGEYAYRPRLTVLQAITIAGGALRLDDAATLQASRDAITVRGDLRVTDRQIKGLTARLARLQAQAAGRDTIMPVDSSQADPDDPDMRALREREQGVLTAQRNNVAAQVGSFNAIRSLYEQEIVSTEAQRKTEQAQLATVMKQVDTMHSLIQKGYAATPQSLEYERLAADTEAKIHELETNMIRARQNISEADEKARVAVAEPATNALSEAQSVHQQIAELVSRRGASERLLAHLVEMGAAGPSSTQRSFAYAIVRDDGQGATEVAATELDVLRPGDVLKVSSAPTTTTRDQVSSLSGLPGGRTALNAHDDAE